MNISELIECAKNFEVGDKEVESLKIRLQEAEEKYEQEDKDRRPTADWYNRVYTL